MITVLKVTNGYFKSRWPWAESVIVSWRGEGRSMASRRIWKDAVERQTKISLDKEKDAR